jgi:hypothetical protein
MLVRIDELRLPEGRFTDQEILNARDHLIAGVVDFDDLERQHFHELTRTNSGT